MFENLWTSLLIAAQPVNLFACFLGALVGTLVGVLPGIGPSGTMAILLPVTFGLGPTAGIIMLAGIWYGAQYGGSTTSILVNVPGEAASVVTCLDGYEMAKKGRAGAALTVSAIGSWLAGTFGVAGLMLFAPPLANAALAFGPPEYFAIALLGLVVLSNLTGRSPLKSFLMVLLGVMFSTVGLDPIAGFDRFTFGVADLLGGVEFVPVTMGLFGIAEILSIVAEPYVVKDVTKVRFRDLYPNRSELRRAFPPMIRGGILGFLVGLIPGPAAIVASFASYGLERKISKHRREFGRGAIEGVAGPESANNSATAGGLVPLLALGLPFAPPTAVLLSGLMIHGVTPGPLLMQQHPEVFWGVIGSMYLGNLILLVLNLPLVGVFASITRLSPSLLMPVILLLTIVGSYGVNNSLFDVWVMMIAGGTGYLMKKFEFEPAPLVLGLVLGRIMEGALRRSMVIMDGNPLAFFQRPLSGVLLALVILLLVGGKIFKAMFPKASFLSQEET
jgi:putative tricarboxylic transport membrane protein